MTKSSDDIGEFDLLKKIEKSPQLTSYVIRNKVSETRKTAVIIGLIAVIVAFLGGLLLGTNITNIMQPKNIVEVQVSTADKD